jgi:hypothetical protein
LRPPIRSFWQLPSDLPTLGLTALAGSLIWTLLGVLVAAVAGQLQPFLQQWFLVQGFFATIAAIYLGLLPFTKALSLRLVPVLAPGASPENIYQPRDRLRFRTPVVLVIFVIGTLTTTQLGFAVPKPTLYFMWATCGIICFLAGFATWHVVEVLTVAGRIKSLPIQVFSYSPSETRSLKGLAGYFTFFGAALTAGYAFALTGTLLGNWKGDPAFVRFVQLLWPLVYVPTCIIVVTYPHIAIHGLIRQEKDRLITLYQFEINRILAHSDSLTNQDIERVNALATLIEKIEKTPNYALTVPITLTTMATCAFNLVSLAIPKEVLASWVQHRFF